MDKEITNQEEQNFQLPTRVTNHDYALTDAYFKECCQRASKIIGREVIPNQRQASKFRNKRGMAYMWGRGRKPL